MIHDPASSYAIVNDKPQHPSGTLNYVPIWELYVIRLLSGYQSECNLN